MSPTITIELPVYGMMVVVGILLALFVYNCRIRAYSYNYRILLVVGIIVLLGMALGAKVMFFITQLPHVISNFSLMHTVMVFIKSGFVFYGGLLGAIGASELSARLLALDGKKLRSFLAPGFALFHAMGRIGCFFGGCCYGIPWEYGFAMEATPDIKRVPVQLIECTAEIIICAIILLKEKRKPQQYDLMQTYLILYSPTRFILEFLRGDTVRGIWLGDLSTSQYISIIIFTVSGILIVIDIVKGKRKQKCDEGSRSDYQYFGGRK